MRKRGDQAGDAPQITEAQEDALGQVEIDDDWDIVQHFMDAGPTPLTIDGWRVTYHEIFSRCKSMLRNLRPLKYEKVKHMRTYAKEYSSELRVRAGDCGDTDESFAVTVTPARIAK